MQKLFLILALFFAVSTMAQQQAPELVALLEEKDPVALQQKLVALGSGGEKDLVLLNQYYLQKRQPQKADSIQTIGAQRFPKSSMAANQLLGKLMMEKDPKTKEALLETFKKDFPNGDMDRAYFGMFYTMAKDKETVDKAIKYAELVKNPNQRLVAAYHVGANLSSLAPYKAEPFLKKKIEEFKHIETDAVDANNPNPAAAQSKGLYYQMLYYYGTVLTKSGRDKEAYPYLKKVYDNTPRKSMELSVEYAHMLYRLGYIDQAFPIFDQLVRDGKGNAELKKQLADSYAKLNPGKDAKAYVAAIEKEVNEKVREEFLKMAVNKPSPAFVLKDEKGKEVSLADFKGKTIVLDFWATWCGPCKKSFPAMQLAVNKYRNDPNVKFLFIHTWETSENPVKEARTYLTANKYSFDLYIDPRVAGTKDNTSALLFGIKGIPQKYVIDGKGNIRFNITGFGGGDDAAVEELSAMIEYVKKNS